MPICGDCKLPPLMVLSTVPRKIDFSSVPQQLTERSIMASIVCIRRHTNALGACSSPYLMMKEILERSVFPFSSKKCNITWTEEGVLKALLGRLLRPSAPTPSLSFFSSSSGPQEDVALTVLGFSRSDRHVPPAVVCGGGNTRRWRLQQTE